MLETMAGLSFPRAARSPGFRFLCPIALVLVGVLAGCSAPGASNGDGSDDEGGNGGGGGQAGAGGPSSACRISTAAPLRRLNQGEYRRALGDLLGVEVKVDSDWLPPDEKSHGFQVNTAITLGRDDVEDYSAAAHEVIELAGGRLEELAGCSLQDSGCAEDFVTTMGRRIFRRPLTSEEREDYLGLLEDREAGVKMALEAMLQSPNFLYRLENPDEEGALSPYEVVTRLAFMLWGSTPDDELLALADDGKLDGETVRKQVQRMMKDDKFVRALDTFHEQWLGLDVAFPAKDPDLYPDFDEEAWQSARREALEFTSALYLEGTASAPELLEANYTFADERLAAIYDVELPEGKARVELDEKRRAGVLTQVGFLAATALDRQTQPIRRGVFIREHLLCQKPPPPPPGLVVVTPPDDGATTTRQRLQAHREDPSCAACHAFFDPLGLAFENYGPIGQWRDEENGVTIDPSGVLSDTDLGDEVKFRDGVELSRLLAKSTTFERCLPEQWVRFAIGRSLNDADRCALDEIMKQQKERGGTLEQLLAAVAESKLIHSSGKVQP